MKMVMNDEIQCHSLVMFLVVGNIGGLTWQLCAWVLIMSQFTGSLFNEERKKKLTLVKTCRFLLRKGGEVRSHRLWTIGRLGEGQYDFYHYGREDRLEEDLSIVKENLESVD